MLLDAVKWFFSLSKARQKRVYAGILTLRKAGVRSEQALVLLYENSDTVPGNRDISSGY